MNVLQAVGHFNEGCCGARMWTFPTVLSMRVTASRTCPPPSSTIRTNARRGADDGGLCHGYHAVKVSASMRNFWTGPGSPGQSKEQPQRSERRLIALWSRVFRWGAARPLHALRAGFRRALASRRRLRRVDRQALHSPCLRVPTFVCSAPTVAMGVESDWSIPWGAICAPAPDTPRATDHSDTIVRRGYPGYKPRAFRLQFADGRVYKGERSRRRGKPNGRARIAWPAGGGLPAVVRDTSGAADGMIEDSRSIPPLPDGRAATGRCVARLPAHPTGSAAMPHPPRHPLRIAAGALTEVSR